VAPRSRTPSRVDRSGHALVTVMVALSRHLQGVAWPRPGRSNLTLAPLRRGRVGTTHPNDLTRMTHCEWPQSVERLHPAMPEFFAQELLKSFAFSRKIAC